MPLAWAIRALPFTKASEQEAQGRSDLRTLVFRAVTQWNSTSRTRQHARMPSEG